MNIVKLIIQIPAAIIGCIGALSTIFLFIRLSWPAPYLWPLKLYISALSAGFILAGMLVMIIGLLTDSAIISITGIYTFLVFLSHVVRVTRAPDPSTNFEQAFGPEWEKRISPAQKDHFLPSRTILWLPDTPTAQMDQDIVFATIPGTDRKLLCDVWQPPKFITPSGLAFIYLHGSAFYLLDKDFGTRPFFSHLAAQGHVIMDVAYRLAPETDIMGMVHDVKRAIAWMKENATSFGVNPGKIVLGGGSAGAHLAMLSAYTTHEPQFTPMELEGKDLSVKAVISEYGATDLEALYYHTNQHLTTRSTPGRPKKPVPKKMPGWMIKSLGKDYHRLGLDKEFEKTGALATLLGGHPDERPESYALFSPVSHINSNCPPTFLIHGEHDTFAPVKSARFLHKRLVEEQVKTVMHILPQTDHAFDLILPKISPTAHTAFYDVERFMALML